MSGFYANCGKFRASLEKRNLQTPTDRLKSSRCSLKQIDIFLLNRPTADLVTVGAIFTEA